MPNVNYQATIKWTHGDTVDATPFLTGTGAVNLTLFTDKFQLTPLGSLHVRNVLLKKQGAPTAKTVTAAISAAELLAGIITTTGATGPSEHQLPTGALLAAAIPDIAVGDSFDFHVINTGTGAATDAVLTVNTGVTIVGNATIESLTDATVLSGSATFRARYTAADTFVVYRIA